MVMCVHDWDIAGIDTYNDEDKVLLLCNKCDNCFLSYGLQYESFVNYMNKLNENNRDDTLLKILFRKLSVNR